ncbi:MAG: TRAP transporter small permease [Syntrophales bacterium]|nr:TRAP transporter small permease [Syntrophales bacterium]
MDKFTRGFSSSLEWIGVAGFLLMFLANFVDVVGAKLFKWPLPGVIEIISFSQVLAIASALAVTLVIGMHIRVEFIVDRFPKRTRGVITAIGSFLSLLLFVLLLWRSYLYGRTLQIGGEIGSSIPVPFYPFAYFIAFSCIPVCLVLLMEIIKSLREAFGNGSN